jgi:DNA-binding transcriptional MerR regulator
MSIGEVAARTGLTERALRHYEAQGLLRPGRTAAGRRVYDAADLEALARISLLKKAGFTVAQIKRLTSGAGDLRRLVEAQLEVLVFQRAQLETAVGLLRSVRDRLDHSDPIDAETLCDVIRTGEQAMQDEQWKKVLDRYYTPEEQEHWRKHKQETAAMAGFDQAAYTKAWEDLNARIEAALPLDPASDEAQGFVTEWNRLLEPFMKTATPEMMEGAGRIWSNIDEWEGEVKSPISPKVVKFISEAAKHMTV